MRMRALLVVLLSLSFTGCTGLSAGQCLHADWYATGYLAGSSGKPPTESLKLQSSCVHYGIVPDRKAFADGWSAGASAAF